MKNPEYRGGKDFADKIIFHYRYFIILYFSLAYSLIRHFEGNLVINSDLYRFALINLLYLILVIVLQVFNLREKLCSLTHRVSRINVDLLYFGTALFLIGDTQYPTYLIYLLPLISAINYNHNRYYFLCSFIILPYFTLLQFLFFLNNQISIYHFIGKTTVFSLFIFVFATILYV